MNCRNYIKKAVIINISQDIIKGRQLLFVKHIEVWVPTNKVNSSKITKKMIICFLDMYIVLLYYW